MKAVVFRHSEKPIGSFAGILGRAGVTSAILDTWRDDVPADFDPLGPDLLIVMGGAPGVYQAEMYPFLRQELKVLEKRLAADLPTLGICLGCQLMAGALGARNYKGEQGWETGWHEIAVTEAGQKTPLRHLDKSLTKIAQSHKDTFSLPQGATLLASSEKYAHQAFSWGRNALAIQSHPETNEETLRAWYVSYADTLDPPKLEQWRQETARYLPAMKAQTEKFLTEWLNAVRRDSEKRYA